MFVEKNFLTRVILSHISVYVLLRSFSNVTFVGLDSLRTDILFNIRTHTLGGKCYDRSVSGKMSESQKLNICGSVYHA